MRPFKPEHYYRAALERMTQAHLLYREQSSYALCMYVAGLAVECMLRAFKGKRDEPFDEKHDVRILLHSSGILMIEPPGFARLSDEEKVRIHREIQVAVEDVHVLWSNDYRFAADDRLRSHLRKSLALRRVARGDILKSAARRLVDVSQKLVDRGIYLWSRS